ncbi:hypothetical protein QF032_002853 [Streptomyces achromogenes]|uniref:hypothetical protein n=1 Tax=Streptomyces achromogenes TaxID=67255 RepID=UPI002785609B|nr:hypothetical protein [Streptomyces achromogenes]MDQ0831009.1 hypothetical protein [Streptomyces achromogenes]
MSPPDDLPPALYEQALSLRRQSPEGLPPGRGFDLPGSPAEARAEDPTLSHKEAAVVVPGALDPLPADAVALHRRFAELGVRACHRRAVLYAVAALPLPAEHRPAARSLARQLTRTGTTVPAVTVGLALLARVGEPEDVPHVFVLGLVRSLTGAALQALDVLDRRAGAVVSLLSSAGRHELRPLVRALAASVSVSASVEADDAAVRRELTAFPAGPRFLDAGTARRVAEAARLPDLLAAHPADPELLARAGLLLVRIACEGDAPGELLGYRDAPGVYETVVGRAGLLTPTLEHHAMLLSLALSLSSGTGALLDWPPGRRESLLAALGRLLARPAWTSLTDPDGTCDPAGGSADAARTGAAGVGPDTGVDPDTAAAWRRRAGWIRRTGRRPFTGAATAGGGLRIEIVAGDPEGGRASLETRVLVDGRPLVPALFPFGPAHGPEILLDEGLLRADTEPRRVRLAEAWCTEGCCGALHVTVRRDGDEVVWEDWRRPALPGSRGPAPAVPALRFDAAAYDAEVTRAETDGDWSWRARRTARLVKAGLTARPELLTRWDARRGWIGTGFDDPDTVKVNFWYQPGLAAGRPEGDPLVFQWAVPDDGAPPREQAEAALRRLAEEDPKHYSRVSGGTRERAEELGFAWPFDS